MNKRMVAVGDLRWTWPVVLTLATVAVVLTATAPASAAATTKTNQPVLAQGAGMGDRPSPAVRTLQRRLRHHGYPLGAPGIDGRFGPLTAGAVRRLQSDYGLATDGIVGSKTRKLLRLIDRPERASVRRPAARRAPRAQPDARRTTAPRVPEPARAPSGDRQDGGTDLSLFIIGAIAALAAFCAALAALATRSTARRRPVSALGAAGIAEADVAPPAAVAAIAAPAAPAPPADGDTELGAGDPVIGYVTLAADARHEGAEAPAAAIVDACGQADWELYDVVTDREAGRGLERPGLNYALRQIAERKARGLVVSDLRRVTHSLMDLGALLEWFRDANAVLVALDLDVDTSTAVGREVAATLITMGGWERERIAQRTRTGLAEVRAEGRHHGRPAVSDRPELADRITTMRAGGMTLQAIADQLNAEGVPTIRGGAMWRPSSVQAALGYRRPGSRSVRDHLPSLEEDRRP